jgi:hypothetical protein
MNLYKVMGSIFGVAVVLFVLSGVFKDDDHGVKWVLGGIGWFGFLLCALVLIVLALVALARNVRSRRTA